MKPSATKNSAFGASTIPRLERQALEARAPGREAEDHHGGEQPQQRVALEQPPAPHELEHDEQQDDGAEQGDELQPVHQIPWLAATGASSPGSTTGRRRASPTNSASRTLTM